MRMSREIYNKYKDKIFTSKSMRPSIYASTFEIALAELEDKLKSSLAKRDEVIGELKRGIRLGMSCQDCSDNYFGCKDCYTQKETRIILDNASKADSVLKESDEK